MGLLSPAFKTASIFQRNWRALLLSAGALSVLSTDVLAQGVPISNEPAGTVVGRIEGHGGRINTFHRGYMYLGGEETTTVWDISDPGNPLLLERLQDNEGNDLVANGHIWWKTEAGDLFYRSYTSPELFGSDGHDYLDISNMLDRRRWTRPTDFPVNNWGYEAQIMPTYPYHFSAAGIRDARIPNYNAALVDDYNIWEASGVESNNVWRLGNLLLMTPTDTRTGVAIFDISGLAVGESPRLLDAMSGNVRQYTNAWHIWQHYLVLMAGDDINGPGSNANILVIDIEDPSNLRIVRSHTRSQAPGRYMHFQDEYGFTGHANVGRKIDMRNGQVVQTFTPLSGDRFGDFQWIPLGNIVMNSSSEVSGPTPHEHATFITHQDGPDNRPPFIGYHLPRDGTTNMHVDTVVGLVINETLDDTTIHDQTIQLRRIVDGVAGVPIASQIISSQYDVINVVPKQLLEDNSTYRVEIINNGIRDVSGNGIESYSFCFSTGPQLDPVCGGEPPPPTNTTPVVQSITSSPNSPVQNNASVTFSLAATDADNDELEYRWDFGDGSELTEYSDSNSIDYTFTEPGNYLVVGQVTDGTSTTSASLNISVVTDTPAQYSSQSSQLLQGAEGRLWTVNPDNNTLALLDTETLTRTWEVATGSNPRSLAQDNQGRLWVANQDSDNLTLHHPDTGALLQTLSLPYGSAPAAIVFSESGDNAYIAMAGSGEIQRWSAGTLTRVDTLTLPDQPQVRSLALDHDSNQLYAARFVSSAEEGNIYRIAVPSLSLAATIALPLDTTSADSGASGRGLPNYIGGLRLHPGNNQVWYTGKKDNTLRGLVIDGEGLTHDTTVRGLIGAVNTQTDSEILARRIDIDNISFVADIAFSDSGNLLFVALQNNNRVVAVNAQTGALVAEADVGFAPTELLYDASREQLLVKNFLSRSVSIVDVADVVDDGNGDISVVGNIGSVASEQLTDQVLHGKRIFYNAADERMASEGYMSCAACHLDGGNDGRVWDFTQLGEGLRNTTALNGNAGMQRGLLHWSGNFDEVQDFEIPIRNLFGGRGFLANNQFNGTAGPALGSPKADLSSDLDALAAYVASLSSSGRSPYKNSDGTLTSSGVMGRLLFEQLQCHSCHSGPEFTDSLNGSRHDVGTLTANSGNRLGGPLDGLDTPSLKGLWQSAPYLHDGSAPTLYDVLTISNATELHASTAVLSSSELNQLVDYLLQIDDDEDNQLMTPVTSSSSSSQSVSSPASSSSSSSSSSVSSSSTISSSSSSSVSSTPSSSVSSSSQSSSSSSESSSSVSSSSVSSISSSSSSSITSSSLESSSIASSESSQSSSSPTGNQSSSSAPSTGSDSNEEEGGAGGGVWLPLLLLIGLWRQHRSRVAHKATS